MIYSKWSKKDTYHILDSNPREHKLGAFQALLRSKIELQQGLKNPLPLTFKMQNSNPARGRQSRLLAAKSSQKQSFLALKWRPEKEQWMKEQWVQLWILARSVIEMNMADSLWHEDEVRVEKTSNIFFDIEQRANNRLLLYSCLEY